MNTPKPSAGCPRPPVRPLLNKLDVGCNGLISHRAGTAHSSSALVHRGFLQLKAPGTNRLV